MGKVEFKVTIALDEAFEYAWDVCVWMREVQGPGERTEWACVHRRHVHNRDLPGHSRSAFKQAVRALV